MIIDCQGCPADGCSCADRAVSRLPGAAETEIDPDVRAAIDLFAEAGMLPTLMSSRAAPSRPPGRRLRQRSA